MTRQLFGFSLLLLSIVLSFMFYRALTHEGEPPRSTLSTQTLIHDAIRVIVQPLHTDPDYPVVFRVVIESTEHFEWVDTDLKTSSILHFEGQDPVLPSEWIVEYERDYGRESRLTFPAQKEIKDLNLSLFLSSEFQFIW
jgi:hypothetical protein